MQATSPTSERRHPHFRWLILIALVSSCAAPPPVKPLTPAQRVERDERVGTDLAARFEQTIHLRSDRAVQRYLESILARLIPASSEAPRPAPRAFVYSTAVGAPWRGFGLPVDRVYLPAPFLRAVEFENELAAVIAIEVAHLKLDHLIQRLSDPKLEMKPSPTIFDFAESEQLAAVEMACALLYHAGYDGRGLISLFQRYQSNPSQSPYEPERVEKMLNLSRRTIALSSPLRNPIVRSLEFMAIQKRMRKL